MTTHPRDIVDRVLDRLRSEVEQAFDEIAGHAAGETAARLATEHDGELRRVLEEAATRQATLHEAAERHAAELVSAAERDAALEADLRAARAQAEDAVHALTEVEAVTRARERDTALAGLERLLAAIQQLDAATSLSDGLDRAANAVASEAERSMVFLVRERHLLGWRHAGLPLHAPAATDIVVPLDQAGELSVAVETGRAVHVHPDAFGRDTAPALAFARLPESRIGLAVPIVIADRTVAVLYADDGANGVAAVPGTWPEAVEIIGRHAARCLEGLTMRLVAARRRSARVAAASSESGHPGEGVGQPESGAGEAPPLHGDEPSARRLARLLISEIKLFNEPTIRIGRDKRDLRARLRAEIERARRAYDEQVPAAVARRAELFDEELTDILAGGDAALLGPGASAH